MRRLSVIGVPSSAGSYAAGQDLAPAALRHAGLIQALTDAGPPGLLYVDRHFDLNTPDSTIDGALDWMGLAHAFALSGTVDALTGAFGHRPLLQPTQVAWLGVDASWATAWEREQADRLGLQVTSSTALADDPPNSATTGLGVLPSGPLAVHIDVDVLDFIDAPLAENTDGRNTGPTLDQLAQALLPAAGDPRLRALSIGELNPTRSAGEPDAIPRFIRMLTATLSATAANSK
jgi:arginase